MSTQITGLTAIPTWVPARVSPGQTLRVIYSFLYRSVADFSTEIWASLFLRRNGRIFRVELAQAKQTLRLAKSKEWKEYTGEIDILIGQIPAGFYNLIVEIPEYEQMAVVDDAVYVVAVDFVSSLAWMLALFGVTASLRIVEEEL